VPPESGGVPVLGAEGQEGRPEILIVGCHRDSFLACRASGQAPQLPGPCC
jgi:hypothetical protein